MEHFGSTNISYKACRIAESTLAAVEPTTHTPLGVNVYVYRLAVGLYCTLDSSSIGFSCRVASRRLVLPDNCALCGCHDTLTRRIYDTRLSPGPRSPCPSHLVSVLDTVVVVVVLQMALRGPHHFLTQSLYSFT